MTLPEWTHTRPSTTIVGTFRPEVVSGPGYRKKGGPSRQNAPGGVLTTPNERAVLQGFPDGFELHGSKGKIALQLGNAVPPPVAQAVLEHLWNGGSE